ncbi:uncharacterized protein LOC121934055 [Sceloporus undulatus]|uniref:uncharacterized protein LOC121934055 n=1 Tax=Sceloporus undulatus TaxID=8520 RepID=UPI001C4BDC63|nr:uncharacterized protein LOC121934055 [Sceloporus undulatus]
MAAGGRSSIDYVLSSPVLMNLITAFEVCHRIESDHMPLVVSMVLPKLATPSSINPETFVNYERLKRIHWNSRTIEAVSEIFKEACALTVINDLANSTTIENALVNYGKIISIVSNKTATYINPTRGRNSWFDKSCLIEKKNLRQIFQLALNSPEENFRPYLKARVEFYKYIEDKKKAFYQQNWADLDRDLNSNDTKTFWIAVRRHLNNNLKLSSPGIQPQIWVSYFTNKMQTKSIDNIVVIANPSIIWSPVSPDEVYQLILKLKSAKSPGYDTITAEVLKHCPELWSKALANLFTLVNNTGVIPTSWKDSIIIPIFKKRR